MKFVAISDTHHQLDKLIIPDGDVLLHAGDFTGRGTYSEMKRAIGELGKLRPRFKRIVAICGNHDRLGEENPILTRTLFGEQDIDYLEDQELIIDGIKIWGTPITPHFCSWAFNRFPGPEIQHHWNMIPDNTDILLSHGPPLGFGDKLDEYGSAPGTNVGCYDLLRAVERIKPHYHVFGHIHESYGTYTNGTTTFINASSCNSRYEPVNAPITFDLHQTTKA